jgi:hypothetical protein
MKSELHIKLEMRWGQPINFGYQCIELSDDILRVTKKRISPQTLRRVCGFIQYKSNIGNNSRLILEDYIGEDVIIKNENNQEKELDFLLPFIKDFYKTPISTKEDFNYQNVCALIANTLFERPKLLKKLGPFLTQNKNSQIYFFERHPYLDGLAGDYTHVLKMYAQEKTEAEAQFYSLALQCLGKKLSNKTWQNQYLNKSIPSESIRKDWHPFLRARAMTLLIWTAHEKGNQSNLLKLIARCKQEQEEIFASTPKMEYFPFYEWIMAEGMLLIEEFELSEYFLELYFQYYKNNKNAPIEPGYHEAAKVFQLFIFWQLNRNKKREQLANKIDPNNFIYLGKRYFMILHNLILINSRDIRTKRKNQILIQLKSDIEFTKYTYFEKYLPQE